MATIRLIPSTYAVSSTSYLSVSDAENMYTNTDSTTYATITNTNASTSSRYLYIRGFNFDDIPSGAEVTSFTVKIKGHESRLSTSTSYAPRLANGTSALSNTTASSNFGTSTSTITIPTGALTWEQISTTYGSNFTIMVYVRRNNRNTTGYFYCYGAEIEVEYETPNYYNITASSAVSGISVTPATQSIREGNNATIVIDVDDISNYTVTDNDTDVTSSLVRHESSSGGTASQTAESYTTELSDSGANFYTSSSSTGNYFNYAVGHTAESPGSTSTSYNTYVKDNDSNTATGWAWYTFDFSEIPSNATVTDVEVKCYGACESTTHDSTHKANITLYSGSTLKSTEQYFTSTSNSIITIDNPGTWTREELQSAKLKFEVAYYGGRLFGITWNVTYTTPSSGYYYTYTITNVQAAHVILLEEAGAFIPPEEDPTKTYYPITISSINAITNPGTGTTRVEAGTSETITISPSDPLLTLALDNGVDITSQLVGGVPSNTYTVTTQASGASYGFTLNSSTGYYVSSNTGVASSAAVCRVNFDCESDCLVTINYINYAEATYDYGIFGQIDTALDTTYSADSNPYLACSTSSYNTSSVQTLTYNLTAGTHYIDIKYRKDNYTDENNDSLQWKIASIEATGTGGDYTYTLSNISQKHSLVFIFGNVSYYFITSSGSDAKLYPDGQVVKLAGDNYHITIVPDSTSATVRVTDNGTDVTSSLEYEEGQDKSGNTVVNYTYRLSNIAAAHTIAVTCSSGAQLYLKINGTWTSVSKVYVKVDGAWVEQSNPSSVFDTSINYVNAT